MLRYTIPVLLCAAIFLILTTPRVSLPYTMSSTSTTVNKDMVLEVSTNYIMVDYESLAFTYSDREIVDFSVTLRCFVDITLTSFGEHTDDVATCKPGNVVTWENIPRRLNLTKPNSSITLDLALDI